LLVRRGRAGVNRHGSQPNRKRLLQAAEAISEHFGQLRRASWPHTGEFAWRASFASSTRTRVSSSLARAARSRGAPARSRSVSTPRERSRGSPSRDRSRPAARRGPQLQLEEHFASSDRCGCLASPPAAAHYEQARDSSSPRDRAVHRPARALPSARKISGFCGSMRAAVSRSRSARARLPMRARGGRSGSAPALAPLAAARRTHRSSLARSRVPRQSAGLARARPPGRGGRFGLPAPSRSPARAMGSPTLRRSQRSTKSLAASSRRAIRIGLS